jgi:hypothetical protein
MRIALKIFLVIVSFLLAFILSLAIAGYFLKDKLTESTLNYLNKQIKAELKVKSVDVSMLKGFPFVSVDLKGVEIFEGSLDTPPELEPGLLSIDEVSIRMGLLGLLKSEYTFEKVILRNGWLNLYFDTKGKGNFEIFEKGQDQSNGWLFSLQEFRLENINLSYIDLRTGWIFKGLIDNAALNGQLSAQQILLNTSVKASIGVLRQGAFYYIQNQRATLETQFLINDNQIEVWPSIGSLGRSKLTLSGNIGREKGAPVWVSVSGENFDIEHLISFLSQHNIALPHNTKTKGNVAFTLAVDGLTKMEEPYLLNLEFQSNGLTVQLPNKPELIFSKIVGKFNNGQQGKPQSSEVFLSNIEFSTGVSTVSGSLRFKNLNSPLYHLKVTHWLNIPDILNWGVKAPIKSGQISGNLEVLGLLDDLGSISLKSFEDSKFYSSLELSNIDFEEVGLIPDLKSIGGQIKINNQDISSASIFGLMHGSKFTADFQASNASAIVFGDQKTSINTSITIDSLNTNWLTLKRSSVSSDEPKETTWDRIQTVTGDVFIDRLVHNQFVATPLSASFSTHGNSFYCNSFLARSCGGLLTGKFSSSYDDHNLNVFSADLDADGIDINMLFKSFNNFGQGVITSDNVFGNLNGSIQLSVPYNDGALVADQIDARADVKVSNGRLVNLDQLKSLSRFIELEDLMDIKFSTLENTLRITDSVIIIPEMDISSSAIDLKVSGTHTFSGAYRYRTQLYLSDVLLSKSMRQKAQNDPFGEVEDDGSGRLKLYLKLEGDSNDYTVSYDKASARDAFRQNLRSEGLNLRAILRDEFSFLIPATRVDTTKKVPATEKKKEEESTKFTIEWD